MNTSQTSFLSEIISGKVIPAGKLEYFRSRLSNRLHEIIIDEFARLSETKSFTKADLARRIGRAPAQITRWLGAPSNWTIDTVSDLALGMGFEPSVDLTRLVEIATTNPEIGAELPASMNVVYLADRQSKTGAANAALPSDSAQLPTFVKNALTPNVNPTGRALSLQQQQRESA